MIIPDVNLLVYAHDSTSRRHDAARRWWEALMNGGGSVGLPWIALLGFVRIPTHSRLLDNPLDASGACARVRSWLARPQAILVHPGDRHADILCNLLDAVGTAGNLTTDAHLAALAIRAPGGNPLDGCRHGPVSRPAVDESARMRKLRP